MQDKQKEGRKTDKSDESVEDGDEDGDEAEYEHPEEADVDPRYALHEAARPAKRDHSEFDFKPRQQAVMNLLLSHGADAHAPYPDGSFVLQAVVEDRGEVRSLLAGLSQTNCNRKGHNGRTLLTSASVPTIPLSSDAWSRNPPTVVADVVHALINSSADPLTVDDEGRTPLHWLCTFTGLFDEAYRKALVALAHHGPAAVKASDNQGRRPLHVALATYASRSQSSAFAIQHLLSLGADRGDPDPVTGNSALHFVAPRLVGEPTAAAAATTLLRELAARVDIDTRNDAGATCVFPFAAAGWERTCDPTRKASHPTYALAHDTTNAKALDVFTDLGADLSAVDERKRNLLHVTAGRETHSWDQVDDIESAFKRLMELGVDPRAEDDELRTAIDVAVARDMRGIVRMFSEEGKKMEEEKTAREEEENSQRGSKGEDDEFV